MINLCRIDKHSSAYLGMATVRSVTAKSVTKRSPHYSAMHGATEPRTDSMAKFPYFVLFVNVF